MCRYEINHEIQETMQYCYTRVISITREEERTFHGILDYENYVVGDRRALFETLPFGFLPFAPFF